MQEILITSSVLILALLVLRLVFAKKVRRRLIYGAWALVALRLLVPVQIGEMDFSILTSAKPVTEVITQVTDKQVAGVTEQDAYREIIQDYVEKDQTVFTPEVQEHIQSAIKDDMPKEEIAVMIDKVYAEQEIFVPEVQAQVQRQVEETADPITLGQIAMAVWLAGVVVMAVWFVIVNLRHSRMLRKNREQLDCDSPIPVYVSEKVGSPCLVGLFHPAVYLTPESAASEETIRHVLTHELTHFAHKDHIWSLVRCVCLCVYWFHPLVWVAAWFSRRDCELACDEGALERLGEEERIAYGKTLLGVVSHAAAHAHLLQTATAMNETKKQLKERVNFIVKKPKLSIIAAVCMVLVCAIVTGCVATGPSAGEEPEAKQTVYLPATYKYAGEYKINNLETGHLSIERQYSYDEAGRCIRCEEVIESEEHGHVENTYQFAYDEKGNLISESKHQKGQKGGREWEGGSSYALHYTYDEYGRAEQCELEVLSADNELLRNATYRFAYDAQGNLETLTVNDETWYYYSYDEQGKMIAETYCRLLSESDPNADTYKYLNFQTVYQRNTQGKVASVYSQFAYSVENVGADGLDQLEFKFNANSYTFHYDEGGNLIYYNLSAGTEVGQQKYDENGQWIPEEKHKTVTIRGEEIDRLLAKYTQDEYGNIVKFENYQYTEAYTYTARELTPTQQKRAEQFFIYPTWLGDECKLPGYVFAYFYPTWYENPTDFKYFVNFYQNLPW